MNILVPDSWLREYLETDATPEDIKGCLSLCGPSIEKINSLAAESVYEIEITTNRIDMASVYGIAREAAAILPRFGFSAILKPLPLPEKLTPLKVLPLDISDPRKLCRRILGIVLDNVTLDQSPDYIKKRLESSGIRSLNNAVDVTNYVMCELGHPVHVFDYDRIKTNRFLIRTARKDELIVTLDGKKFRLCENDVIIDDGTGRVIDLPGIMGTKNSVVSEKTKRIILFIESNDPVRIRKSSLKYGIRTMAATINEKSPDPELARIALERGIGLMRQLTGAEPAGQIIDLFPEKPQEISISVTAEFINDRLGKKLSAKEIIEILSSLNFKVNEREKNILTVVPPAYRRQDISLEEDIVEEVARIYGYHNLPSYLMEGKIPVLGSHTNFIRKNQIKKMLKYWGYTETYSYSFVSEELIAKAKLSTSTHLKLANPLTNDFAYMRTSLVPSLLEVFANNQALKEKLKLFEFSAVYLKKDYDLPDEPEYLVITENNDFYKHKGTVEGILRELEIRDWKIKSGAPEFWHPGKSLTYMMDREILAYAGEIHPDLKSSFVLKESLSLAQLDIEVLLKFASDAKIFQKIISTPEVIENFSILITKETSVGSLIDDIKDLNKLINRVRLTDKYTDSINLEIRYRHPERNLNKNEVEDIRQQIEDLIATKNNLKSGRKHKKPVD
ncbi:phenylalanine--tRNA ligase subunit beta [Candidatus Gottesmanbacteria bacterium RIFCSPLOWO2_02_FULL_42_29]|uniref:Phenylalanine--tRNA ligase beta subunit n=2 Tax=Candidatus Gottesmaniibacteriota TaxID=1752720 RepID=A0A1F6BB54_9BACT|nr:MAG: Phenylalanine-tRNA ligase beta subunit [Candidatus Gottesmanbacteria bacterium GW2011_GWA2_42_18]OGG10752.1 MAG: phenylalanine--tRNA ligase subunit beta [Candidatus Gottesmanbacteria bacterium RIFCSPHIGHO2_01_FULL_42_27]OGG21915.1 MAG: phenylalanine--tRNA ligase subunit beta [Candidatus Gottesmanbacteria bacterium RIFCSPHIGHO2_12_FULL_43_26]OGG34189.1 MAG: phenylalanine--tRNA ligase subunit beta [Candidatus Gottesmanbacteria bacterium RIFCSPLOWO2_01_FULL_42_22]OGG38716.1 MAG: phenylalan